MESVILYVSDLDRAIAFYRDVLEVPFAFSDRGYAEFRLDNLKLGLLERERAAELTESDRPPAGSAEILFPVEDADAWATTLREANVEILSGPMDHPWGHRSLHVADPDGHVVELAQQIHRTRTRGT
ncbi:MAG TPA: VOC family protein [Actinomycetota bacterium]|jgi:lactoylglutathione lyase|nr:VOC family protein [Actinomycetota bacterium]